MKIKNSKQLAKSLGKYWQPGERRPVAEAVTAHNRVHGPYGLTESPIWLATFGNCSGDGVTPKDAVRHLVLLLREEARVLENSLD